MPNVHIDSEEESSEEMVQSADLSLLLAEHNVTC